MSYGFVLSWHKATVLHKPIVPAYLMGECIDHFEREKRELWLLGA